MVLPSGLELSNGNPMNESNMTGWETIRELQGRRKALVESDHGLTTKKTRASTNQILNFTR
jgi:hypothetical protein